MSTSRRPPPAPPRLPQQSTRKRVGRRSWLPARCCCSASAVAIGVPGRAARRTSFTKGWHRLRPAALAAIPVDRTRSSPARGRRSSARSGSSASPRAHAVPIGIGAAIYLEEFADQDRWYNRLIELNIQNLAAVPSIVYGILGLGVHRPGSSASARPSSPAGHPGAARAADRDHRLARGDPGGAAVDPRRARWRSARRSGRRSAGRCCRPRFPASPPASILALSRAIGEAAPLILIGARSRSSRSTRPGSTAASRSCRSRSSTGSTSPQDEFTGLAAAAIVVLLVVLLA